MSAPQPQRLPTAHHLVPSLGLASCLSSCLVLCTASYSQDCHDTTMSEKRRAEIEAKRAKLVELRKARAERQKADAERRVSEVCIHRRPFPSGCSTMRLISLRAQVVLPAHVGMLTTWSTPSSGQATAERLSVRWTLLFPLFQGPQRSDKRPCPEPPL